MAAVVNFNERREEEEIVIQTHSAVDHRWGIGAAPLPPGVARFDREPHRRHGEPSSERALDQVLADSFPASDPPSWTPGIARLMRIAPAPAVELDERDAVRAGTDRQPDAPHTSRTSGRALRMLADAATLALFIPVAVLLIGLPVALAVRGVAELAGWLLAR